MRSPRAIGLRAHFSPSKNGLPEPLGQARGHVPLSVTNLTGVGYGSNWTQDGKEDKCAHRTFSWTRGQARKPNTPGLWISSTLFGNNQMRDVEHRRIKAIALKIGRLSETRRGRRLTTLRKLHLATIAAN